jgi:GABA(A) receptor-associated protein
MFFWKECKACSRFKSEKTFDERVLYAKTIMEKHPDRIPIILEKKMNATSLLDIDKIKYLVPKTMTMANFMVTLRSRTKMDEYSGMYIFVNNTLVPNTAVMSQIYDEHCDEDGFLYMVYSGENTFG